MRRLVPIFAGLIALALPAWTTAATKPASVESEIAQIEEITAKIRQLIPRHGVKVVLPGNGAFNADWSNLLRQDTPTAEVDLDKRESVVLGLLARRDNLTKILFGQSASQIAGFYDYHRGTLFVRNNANQVLGPDRYVIAHEYTHALQDQHYHLARLVPDQFPLQYRNSDAVSAHHALTEGDAVVTETLFIRQTYTRQDLDALNKLQLSIKPAPLPKAMQRELYFPYTTGVSFVSALYKKSGMAGVDAAYHRLPASTYEIMHPSAYFTHWKPTDVILHAVQGFADWQQLDDDQLGAFGYKLILWQFLPEKTANTVTDDFRGDRYLFLEKGNQNAMLLKSIWATPAAATTARRAFLDSLRNRWHHAHIRKGVATTVVNGASAVYLTVAGPDLTVAYAPTLALATQLGSAPTT
jgi:hypothetical protein